MIPNQSDISEAIFQETAAECFLQYERYRLKTNVIGINLEKDFLDICYETLQTRITERYSLLYQHLRQGLASLYKNFTIAQASALRILNNIMRDYRRRVGTLSNEPLSNFKYNRFDRSEKMLLESLLYNEKHSYDQILKFQQQLTIAMEQGKKEIQQKYQQNKDIRQDYKKVLQVIDKTQCFSYKYYENFQRSMQTTISTLESCFEKLNGYLTVWENIGSTKAYEVKSAKELEMEAKPSDYDNKRFTQDETEEQLEQLLNSCPPNSIQREEYRRKLNQLRHYNMERDRKLQMVGRMFNKRKNRVGILVNKRRDVTILDWYFDTEGNRVKCTFQDEFKNYNSQSESNEFRLTQYEMQRPLKRQKIEQMKHSSKQQQNHCYSRNEWLYDKYGKVNQFDMILCTSQQIQARVDFEMNKQYELQCADDRRKRDLFQKQTYQARDAERRQSLHIGYLHPYEKTETELLQKRGYHTEYLPEIVPDQDSSIQFSDQQHFQRQEVEEIHQNQARSQESLRRQIGQSSELDQRLNNTEQRQSYTPIIQMGPKKIEIVNEQQQVVQLKQATEEQTKEEVPFSEACLAQQIIRSYFREYSSKIVRKQDQPFYKKSKFLYFSDWSVVPWQTLSAYFEHEKIFVYTSSGIAYFKRVFSIQKEKIKCIVYTLEDIQQDLLRQKITECFASLALITVKFVSLYPDLEKEQLQSFMIGLLLTLLKYGEMPEDYQNADYIQAGRQILEDFNYYFYPESCTSSKTAYMKRFKPIKPKEVFEPSKRRQPQDGSSKQSTTASSILAQRQIYRQTITASAKGSSNLLSSCLKVEQKQEIVERQREQQKIDLTTDKYEERQDPSQLQHLKPEEQTVRMRRSDSRQNLNNYDVQVSLVAREKEQQQASNSEEDYENI